MLCNQSNNIIYGTPEQSENVGLFIQSVKTFKMAAAKIKPSMGPFLA